MNTELKEKGFCCCTTIKQFKVLQEQVAEGWAFPPTLKIGLNHWNLHDGRKELTLRHCYHKHTQTN